MDRQRNTFLNKFLAAGVLARIVWVAAAEATILAFLCATTAPTYEVESNPSLATPSASLPSLLQTCHVQTLYESSESGSVPWRDWWPALPSWLLLHLVLAVLMFAVVSVIRPRWEKERIPYPMLGPLLDVARRRTPSAMVGFGCGLLAGAVILPTAVIRFPVPLQFINSAADLSPMLIALCLLMPRDASGSVVVWWFLLRVEAWTGRQVFGISTWPMAEHQAYGAYAMIALLAFKGMKARRLVGLVPLMFVVGSTISFVSQTGIMAFVWLGGLLLLLVGYAIVRCNIGMPVSLGYPYDVGDHLPFWLLGARRLGSRLSARLLSLHCFTRGGFPFVLSLSGEAQGALRLRTLPLMAVIAGLVLGGLIWLRQSYAVGLNMLGWTGGIGNMWAGIAVNQQKEGMQMTSAGLATDWQSLSAVSAGGISVALGYLLRRAWLFSPLHPMAFPLAATWGGMLWGPCLVAWVIRRLDKFGRNASRNITDFAAGFVLGAGVRRLIATS